MTIEYDDKTAKGMRGNKRGKGGGGRLIITR